MITQLIAVVACVCESDGCHRSTTFPADGNGNVMDVDLRRRGWARDSSSDHVCPECMVARRRRMFEVPSFVAGVVQ